VSGSVSSTTAHLALVAIGELARQAVAINGGAPTRCHQPVDHRPLSTVELLDAVRVGLEAAAGPDPYRVHDVIAKRAPVATQPLDVAALLVCKVRDSGSVRNKSGSTWRAARRSSASGSRPPRAPRLPRCCVLYPRLWVRAPRGPNTCTADMFQPMPARWRARR
jgi:hypothetical protein